MDEKNLASQELIYGVLQQVSMHMRGDLSGVLSAITQISDKLDACTQNESTLRQLAILRQSYYRLLRLATNLSAVTDANAFVASYPRTEDMVSICREVMEKVECATYGMGISMSFSASHSHLKSFVDKDLMERLLLNLLSNALRATPKGGKIHLDVSQEGEQVLLRLSDTGCGIPEEKMATLFQRYLQTDRRELDSGLGVGLAVCQKIAQVHGGTMVITSTPGAGTVVTVSLERSLSTMARLSTFRVDYTGGHDRTLTELADVLPPQAYEE